MFCRYPPYVVIFSIFDALKTRFLVKKFENSVDAEISDDHLSAFQRVLGFETFFGTYSHLVFKHNIILGTSTTLLLTSCFSLWRAQKRQNPGNFRVQNNSVVFFDVAKTTVLFFFIWDPNGLPRCSKKKSKS